MYGFNTFCMVPSIMAPKHVDHSIARVLCCLVFSAQSNFSRFRGPIVWAMPPWSSFFIQKHRKRGTLKERHTQTHQFLLHSGETGPVRGAFPFRPAQGFVKRMSIGLQQGVLQPFWPFGSGFFGLQLVGIGVLVR